MESIGIIRGFRKYTSSMLEQMREDLCLSISQKGLSYCINYYRSIGRDPLVDEMKMLDRFITTQARSTSSYAPISMMTNDDFVAQTYADMINKRKALAAPNLSFPATLSEIFGITNDYLSYAGKTADHSEAFPLLENRSSADKATQKDSFSSKDSRYKLSLIKRSTVQASNGDLLLLLLPCANLSHTQNGTVQKQLLRNDYIEQSIVGLVTVEEGGLLRTLLSISDGLRIEWQRISRTGEQVPLGMLADGFVGYEIVRIKASELNNFYKTAQSYGVAAMAFAQITDASTYTISRGMLGCFSIDSAFLRTLIPIKATNVTLRDEKKDSLTDISSTFLPANGCKYLSDAAKPSYPQLLDLDKAILSVASTRLSDAYFRNTIFSASVPILALAASGCSYTDISLSVGITFPAARVGETVDIGPHLSTLLGLYRILAELGVPLATRRMDTAADLSCPHLTIFGHGNGRCLRSEFAAASNYVHYAIPSYMPNGLLDFAALRALLARLTELNRSGELVSARVLTNESLTDGLLAMSSATVGCKIEKFDLVGEGAIPIAILLESKKRLDLPFIGKTTERPAKPTCNQVLQLPNKPYLLPNDTSSILILSQKNDIDAVDLEWQLREHGGRVTRLTDCSDIPSVCHAILASRTVILCGNAVLPQTNEAAFAIETFSKAGGWILLAGAAKCGYSLPVISLKDGISQSIIEQICK